MWGIIWELPERASVGGPRHAGRGKPEPCLILTHTGDIVHMKGARFRICQSARQWGDRATQTPWGEESHSRAWLYQRDITHMWCMFSNLPERASVGGPRHAGREEIHAGREEIHAGREEIQISYACACRREQFAVAQQKATQAY